MKAMLRCAALALAATPLPPDPPAALVEDGLDRPSAASVAESRRAGMGHEMEQAPYVHRDADLVPDAQASGHEEKAETPPADPHAGHHMPADHP